MTNFRITFTGGANGLYTRRIKTQAVIGQDAVEFKPAKYDQNHTDITPAVEAKEAVPFKAAEWEYVPFTATFEFENTDGIESGAEVFRAWLEGEGGSDTLSDMLNIFVEKEAKSYEVSYDKAFTAEVTAELAAANDLNNSYEVEQWLDENGDSELDYPEDTGELNNINVDENSDEYVEVEWNG
jgi:hypothetical protein